MSETTQFTIHENITCPFCKKQFTHAKTVEANAWDYQAY